ncbi:hypothetical protein [Rathayibacter sp. VKM Ac-2805]|uniref:hypothetical protein n=1 Tax=Rathayibacter sp. VKM Ac-2805 TaxID=2609258 RepID=UPI00131F6F20|nr:hypothetical protein [Rathayibacter sp. VKM Ac-2805]QHC73789.1 hypothetical protein GSU40_08935 [Rathayibacter sp. VKM Ac-2805]
MELGSWAEWVGAIATSVTFIGGAYLWRRDLADKKRALAERFRVVTKLKMDIDNETVTFDVIAHNTGDSPIYSASVAFFDEKDQYQYESIAPVSIPAMDLVLDPGESKITNIDVAIDPRKYDPVISFSDGNGHRWHRRLKDGSYRSRRWLEAWRTKQRQMTWVEAKLFDIRIELNRQRAVAARRERQRSGEL